MANKYHYGIDSNPKGGGMTVPVYGFSRGGYSVAWSWESTNLNFDLMNWVQNLTIQNENLTVAIPYLTMPYYFKQDYEKLRFWVGEGDEFLMPVKYTFEFSRARFLQERLIPHPSYVPYIGPAIKNKFGVFGDSLQIAAALTFTGITSFVQV